MASVILEKIAGDNYNIKDALFLNSNNTVLAMHCLKL